MATQSARSCGIGQRDGIFYFWANFMLNVALPSDKQIPCSKIIKTIFSLDKLCLIIKWFWNFCSLKWFTENPKQKKIKSKSLQLYSLSQRWIIFRQSWNYWVIKCSIIWNGTVKMDWLFLKVNLTSQSKLYSSQDIPRTGIFIEDQKLNRTIKDELL